MAWYTQVKYSFKNGKGETISGEFEHVSMSEFPDLAEEGDKIFKILERHSHECLYELMELETVGHRKGFKRELQLKGWKMKEVASRWGVTPRQMTNIAKEPRTRDWDMLDGLPKYSEA